jgi:protein-disulfide isomerase
LKNNIFTLVAGIAALTMIGCSPSASQLKKAVEENPDIVFGAIEKNPAKFIEVVNKAAREAQGKAREDEEKAEQARVEEEFKNPKKPEVTDNDVIFGNKAAPVTVIEYSDFQCPYCGRGYQIVKEIQKNYGDKVRIVYKNLPLEMHPMAMPAAKYFTAIAKQDTDKAHQFHNLIFENQDGLKGGTKFLEATAKKVGADMAKLKKDVDSDMVKKAIEASMAEAKKFDFSGTPGFLVNGVSVRGAYPFEYFKKIIDRQLGNVAAAAGPTGSKPAKE